MNICKHCEITYFVTANQEGSCANDDKHLPRYDFKKSDNILECEI